ncbi:MAG: ATP-binding protein [Humidesulfovibrio sp.]|uniref:ATP-binding protein n=1 Tax=Humidesulfovibrio sp. TaxID=2910988 RepID=UPI0027FA839F|nr:ATP-binding protein [Humidesulfovibrio sp.]MDQ7835726.1 ATP-binding protein [Humidesulfovibrio sp.]
MSLLRDSLKRYGGLSLKNKIFGSILAVVLLISVAIAFVARYILVSSLTSELEMRGSAVAHSIAERGSTFMLDKKYPQLLSLIFDEARLHERKHLISYIFITDQGGEVLAHTLVRPFPSELRLANQVPQNENRSVRLVTVENESIHDIAVPIKEGLYRIGTVHVGLSKSHIDSLISKLRLTFLGFISAIIGIIFFLSNRITQYITRPISKLTRISDELSRGNFDISLDFQEDDQNWRPAECPAYVNTEMPCWHFDQSARQAATHRTCKNCVFYRKRSGDEVVQLGDSFRNMVWSIKLYRRRLRESEEKYRSLFDSGPDPVFVVDCENFQIVDVNPRALELYGYDKDELLGMSYLALGPENRSDCLITYEGKGGGSGCLYHPKVLHYKKGAKPFYVNVHACPISYRGRHAIIIAVTDITEMIEKDAQVIQAGKMKSLGEMSAGIAHELNQPLNAIKMGSEFLALMEEQGRSVSPEQFHQVVLEISAQVDRAAEIINTLRAFGRKAEMLKERIDVNKPIGSVLTIVRRQFELDNIRFNLDLGQNLPTILAQDNRLQQVFFNLLTNARDAINEASQASDMDAERAIGLRTCAEGGGVGVEISDTGVGIPDDVRDKIFEPFFTTKETGQGMGLGLAITYGIVRDYGGQIRIDSEPGKGTTFHLFFPQTH